MFSKNSADTRSWIRSWPVIFTVVAAILAGLHILRVNQPKGVAISEPSIAYATKGPLISGRIAIEANNFHSHRIELNHAARLNGSFRTPNIRLLVSVIVLTEQEFERWNAGSEFRSVVRTGFVPGGKISPVLEPGTYFLILDNRLSVSVLPVDVDFNLE